MTTEPWGPPDRQTGLPRPVPGPIIGSGKTCAGSTQAFTIIVPPGRGPVLQTYHEQRTDRFFTSGLVFGILILSLVLRDGGVSWMSAWPLWVMILGLSAIFFLILRRTKLAAGAEWFQSGKNWVDLYDLCTINVVSNSINRTLELVDRDGRRLTAKLNELQYNPRLWALVYHGLLYSVGECAEINNLARRELFFA